MIRRVFPAALLFVSCASSTPPVEQAAPPAQMAEDEPIQELIEIDPRPQVVNATPCGEGATPPERATLVVLLHDADGSPVIDAGARVDPCCEKNADGACEAARADEEGRIVVEACPAASRDVIVSVETNPRWFKYTPPRPARICAAITEIEVLVEEHPRPPG